MIEMKGLVTGGGGLCWVKYVMWWHAVIKSSPGLTAQHLFTEDFFSLTVLSLHPSLHHPPPPTHTHCLAFCLYFSPPQSPSCRLTLSLRLASVTQSLNPVRTSNNKLSGAAQLQKRCISFCTNPFVLSSFIFVYLHRPGGKELLEHLGNVVCDFLNLAWG